MKLQQEHQTDKQEGSAICGRSLINIKVNALFAVRFLL